MTFRRFLLDSLLRTIAFPRHFIFHSVEKTGEEHFLFEYPSIIAANHISPADVAAMPYLNRFTVSKEGYTIPAREDFLLPGFLVKEFRPRGVKKFFLKGIDSSGIIPFLLKYVNTIPVKRPFRDNARELIKSGKMRDEVNQNWEILAEKIKEKNNLFLFPEGTYSRDGYISQIRQGISIIRTKVPNLKINTVTLTYDFLSFKKPSLNVHIGKLEEFPDEKTIKTSDFIRDRLGKGFAVTSGNIFSFILYSDELKTGMAESELFRKTSVFIKKLISENFIVSSTAKKLSESLFSQLTEKALAGGFLKKEEGLLKSCDSLYAEPEGKNKDFRKENTFLYHRNQLRFFQTKLESVWNSRKF
ncbi:MAG TPA: lysophospholipid acyltransferase family protein [Leptospiraceae bacterium]|nr:lysophospholipid acyltransferase family protein [Leptospiraceae bacterium]HMZ57601.1 lysophospholipid acyltransferase family protein [Leptospiraceae bacterium]HNF12894.1 lysophospholipid acyltransferase family protein [Leptospiraceae bacterium]HNF26972.1 lysophospholipid acyltransferase family protein [Leptospiraceae bacterium]HNI95166.1 lysophospholipid acyltransferase family protein [Leptospiraceae bacterium]